MQARTRCGSRSWGTAFCRNISGKIVFVKCPCTFGPRRFPQRLRRGVLKLWVCGSFMPSSRMDGFLWDRAEFFLQRLLWIPGESLPEDVVEVQARSPLGGPCVRSLQMPCLRGACVTALVGGIWEVIVWKCRRPFRSSRSFFYNLVKFF